MLPSISSNTSLAVPSVSNINSPFIVKVINGWPGTKSVVILCKTIAWEIVEDEWEGVKKGDWSKVTVLRLSWYLALNEKGINGKCSTGVFASTPEW